MRVRSSDQLGTLVFHKLYSKLTCISKAFHCHGGVFHVYLKLLCGFSYREPQSSACGFISAKRATNCDRFACDKFGLNVIAFKCRVCVHYPSHFFAASVNIWSGNVCVRTNNVCNSISVAPCKAFQLAFRHLLWVTYDATLASAVWNICNGTLPSHPHREGLNLIDGDLRVIADASLVRTAGIIML